MNRKTYTSTREQREAIESQFARFALALDCAEPRELPRTYGFEIETPSADTIRDNALSALSAYNAEAEANNRERVSLREILDFKADGSVTGESQNEDCECDCSSCVYHDCDCSDCELNNNGDPDHDCGSEYCYNSGEYQEITSIGGTSTTHPLSLEILAQADLRSAEINDTCGLHVHVGSADLTPSQVAQVISAYRVIADLLEPVAERRGAYYCQDNTEEDANNARRGYGTEKYRAVNTAPHFGRSVQTIEFRQHAGTNSTHAVRAFAVLMVALVEYAKANRAIYWLTKCQDFDQLAEELGIERLGK